MFIYRKAFSYRVKLPTSYAAPFESSSTKSASTILKAPTI